MPSQIREVSAEGLGELTARACEQLEPAIVRGLAAGLPVVNAAREGDGSLLRYLADLARPVGLSALHASPQVEGKFGYTRDLSGFNFTRHETTFQDFVTGLLEGSFADGAIAVQGVQADRAVPGFAQANAIPLLPEGGEFRLWLGTRAEVAIHCDPAPNVAYVAGGRRRFTLFAPEEIGNLYMGPFDPVPNGTQISLADPLAPDLDRFPRFAQALEHSLSAELEPGDAIFIPTGWYHHVQALGALNLLVNYWWRGPGDGPSPWDALMHGFMAIRTLPPAERRVWRAMFAHYIFEDSGDPGAHIPASFRGILAQATPQMLASMRQSILRSLASPRS
ncbi:MAG: cupin-like domain-containing protein [Erythrobacter sp.]|jgi:hypothetical protein